MNEEKEQQQQLPAVEEYENALARALTSMGNRVAFSILNNMSIDCQIRLLRKIIREYALSNKWLVYILRNINPKIRQLAFMEIYSKEMQHRGSSYFTDILKNAIIEWQDIISLDKAAIHTVLRNVKHDTLAMALVNEEEQMKEHFYNCMSRRAAQILKEDIEINEHCYNSVTVLNSKETILITISELLCRCEILRHDL
jgi:flagellar motor switch protein FliG